MERPPYWKKGNIHLYDSLGSSNSFLKDNLKYFQPFDVVWVLNQWAGRGKYAKHWYGHKGESLTFSLLLPNILANSSIFALTQVAALFVCQTLDDLGINNSIKFPNDILINHKKMGGILTESCFYFKEKFLILGIGLNVNFKKKTGETIEQNFTSLHQHLDELSLESFFQKILTNCEIYLKIWERSKFADLKEKWIFKSNILNKYVNISVKGALEFKKVKVISINDEGDLMVSYGNNDERVISSHSFLL